MLNRRGPAFLAVLLLAGVFLYGVLQLFALRYERGDVYPAYSSLRPDPIGTKAIHDALGGIPGLTVHRNFRPLPRLGTSEPVTLVYAGVSHQAQWEPGEFDTLQGLVRSGSRAIFTFDPIDQPPDAYALRKKAEQERARRKSPEKKKEKKKEDDEEEKESPRFAEALREWGVTFDWLPASETEGYRRRARAASGSALEAEISWHSAIAFSTLSPEWTTHYTSSGQPVLIERPLGRGSVVLAGDSFFLSNEALSAERHPRLLGQLFSGPRRLIFEESHHGIRDSPGVATLARKYRLHAAVAALILLCLLFIWKCTAPFLPPREEEGARDGVVLGKEGAEGFVNLLRRSIPPGQVLATCVEEWRKTSRHSAADRARLEEAWAAEQARPSRERNSASAYRTLARALTRRS